MTVQERLIAAIEFCLQSKTSATLEEVGHEYRRRSISGNSLTDEGGGRPLRDWIEKELSDTFKVNQDGEKPTVEFRGRKSLSDQPISIDQKIEILSSLKIGTGIAERRDDAKFAFLPTNAWRAFAGDTHDVFVGAKGSGKSQILQHAKGPGKAEVSEGVRIIHVDAAKDQYLLPPKASLKPLSTDGHKGIWLLLLTTKAYLWAKENRLDADYTSIEAILHEVGLLEGREIVGKRNRIVTFLLDLSKNIEFSAKAEIEGIGALEIRPTEQETDSAALMRKAERSAIRFLTDLSKSLKSWIWFAVDRTDILFDGDRDLELHSLHALISIVRDDIGNQDEYQGFKVKLFLKSDVWDALSKRGIPEFSHLVARRMELVWTVLDLEKVIVSRFIDNEPLLLGMCYKKNAAIRNRVAVEDFYNLLLPSTLIPDRGGGRKARDWVLHSLRDASSRPSPRDYIQFFRKVIDCERQQNEDEGGAAWRRRHLFQQKSLVMARKLLALEKLETCVGEFPRVQELAELVRRGAKRVFSHDDLDKGLGHVSPQDLDRFCGLGVLRRDTLSDEFYVPWFYFDALISRERQISSGYDVANTRETDLDKALDSTTTKTAFIRCTYRKIDLREELTALGRKIRLPGDAISPLRAAAIGIDNPIEFWIYATLRGTWILDSSRPLIVGIAYEFKAGGTTGTDQEKGLCVDSRIGLEFEVALSGVAESDLGSVVLATVTGIDRDLPLCAIETN